MEERKLLAEFDDDLRKVRKLLAEFGDDLRKEDIEKLMFLREIPQGIQERLIKGSAVAVFQYLEQAGRLDFENPSTVVEMMRDIKKENWATKTEKKFGIRSFGSTSSSSSGSTTSLRPVQETCISPGYGVGNTSLPDSDSPVLRKQPSQEIKLSNSLKRRMKLDNIVGDDDVEELEKMYHNGENRPACKQNCNRISQSTVHTSTASRISQCDEHMLLYRTSSSVSKRSSGYSSGAGLVYFTEECLSDDEEDTDTEQQGYDEYCGRHGQCLNQSESRNSTIGSRSTDGYTTANDDDEGVSDVAKIPSKSSIYAPPRNGLERLEGEMEIHTWDLQRAVEKKQFGRVYHSNCFPSFSSEPGLKFQLHLYPNSMGSSSSCALYLVVLGWSKDKSMPSLKLEVSASEYDIPKGEYKILNTEKAEVNIMKDTLPPTPPDVGYKNIALFPSLIPHAQLCNTTNDNKTLVVRMTLEYRAVVQ